MSSGIKSFVSEKQIEEKRKARQEEWDRVRKPEDPKQAPEEEYDPRSLYERLKEQQDKKQEEFDEQLKFKNHFRGINQEESEFLDDVQKRSMELEREKRQQERRELEDFRNEIAQSRELPEVDINVHVDSNVAKPAPKKAQNPKKNLQQSIIKGAVKRKAVENTKTDSDTKKNDDVVAEKSQKIDSKNTEHTETSSVAVHYPSAAKCIGILPGLAAYDDDESGENSDDTSSSDDDGAMISNNLLTSVLNGPKAHHDHDQ